MSWIIHFGLKRMTSSKNAKESLIDHHDTVIRTLAFKWLKIAFSCWKIKTPFDEAIDLEALKKRGSPLTLSIILQ